MSNSSIGELHSSSFYGSLVSASIAFRTSGSSNLHSLTFHSTNPMLTLTTVVSASWW